MHPSSYGAPETHRKVYRWLCSKLFVFFIHNFNPSQQMKKFTARQLHSNFILIHDFVYDNAHIKGWVRKDITYNGGYHEKMDFLIEAIQKIGDKTGYELVMGAEDSHWNNEGENPFQEDFGGYNSTMNIYIAIVTFIKWWHKAGSYARTCDSCKNGMNEGYCISGGESYYCSDKCLYKKMTKKEYLELYDNGEGDSYWTDWDPETDKSH